MTFLSQDRKLLFGANRKPVDIFSLISIFKLIVFLASIDVKLMFKCLYLIVGSKINFKSGNENFQKLSYTKKMKKAETNLQQKISRGSYQNVESDIFF